ncbi:STAS domain-containing protein [Nocardioides sp. BP30]|uniref:STAS domain-containing protein n=1 Tax=Nocardioides sp. BP30 TaxID=3036374 RepID=UPI002468F017|nr:STAS domain-containing protein [Nocardioides sp. BP30]WGL52366.1 STAS domain-containing protein [Nocardioides sp. BP30]
MDLDFYYSGDETTGPRTSLAVTGFIDLSTSEALLDAGLRSLWSDPALELDLSAVDFMDAAGVAALSALRSAAERLGKTFEITAVSFAVHRVLQILDLIETWSVPRPRAQTGDGGDHRCRPQPRTSSSTSEG